MRDIVKGEGGTYEQDFWCTDNDGGGRSPDVGSTCPLGEPDGDAQTSDKDGLWSQPRAQRHGDGPG